MTDTQKPSHFHLGEHDVPPVSVKLGTSPIIFAGPHNGIAVPQCMTPCLGMPRDWFYNAHEASDLHIDDIFAALMEQQDDASFIWGNYSRLICDLNRKPEFAITRTSSEYQNILIPQNQPDTCCIEEERMRLKAIYDPYHDKHRELIEAVRDQNYGQAIVIELHSFTPTWQETQRNVEIGTIRCEKTPLSRTLERFLKSQDDYQFVSGQPYRVAERHESVAPLLTETNNQQYLGIEIRNDLISTPEGQQKMVDFCRRCTDYLLEHNEFELIASPRDRAIKWSGDTERNLSAPEM